ncbi:hypothetical protein [Nicoliella lavandulae]|uniref:CopG family transcriptional regulator n=1 Tax=Nicoliella lavandulae TaxID=3082954 RepID=A0ABU8SMU4_9LACO
MTNKRKSFGNENLSMDSDLDQLFKNKDPKESKEPKEHKLRSFSSIKDYYLKTKDYKQYTIYLPPEIQSKLKSKAIEDDESVSDVIKELVINHYLSDKDIKDAYDRGYNRRNSN